MTIKKTKSGKFSFGLSAQDRADLYFDLAGFIESESVNIMFCKLKDGNDVLRHLFYCAINTLIVRQHTKFFMPEQNFVVTRAEAIALLWFLREKVNGPLLNLKSQLHKHLLS